MTGSGDALTDEWARAGRRPDCIGWKAIAAALMTDVRTVQRWEASGEVLVPVMNLGGKVVAGYSERLMACALSPRRRVA